MRIQDYRNWKVNASSWIGGWCCLQGKGERASPELGASSQAAVRDPDLTMSYQQRSSPGTLCSMKSGRGAPPSPVGHGERRRAEIRSLSQEPNSKEPSSMSELRGIEGKKASVNSRLWESLSRKGCSSPGSSLDSRRASGHRCRAAVGRGTQTHR